MRRPTRLLALLLALVFLGTAPQARAELPAGAETAGVAVTPVNYLPLVTSLPQLGSTEQQVVDLTNALRAQFGCGPLSISAKLTAAAQAHSADMATNNFMDHVGSDGSTLSIRLNRVSYVYQLAAENIAAGFTSADSVVNAWSQSPNHRANMLNCSLTEIGVALSTNAGSTYGTYWTQDFGTP